MVIYDIRDRLAASHSYHSVCHVGKRLVVSDKDNGHASLVRRLLKQRKDRLARHVVKGSRRLVAQQKLRILGKRTCDRHSLLLSARKL